MDYKNSKATRLRIKLRQRSSRPRLSVFRSNKSLYAQVIDDATGKTLAAARGTDAKAVGKAVAERALKVKANKVVFDRGRYAYHGKIAQLADAARQAGLKL